MDVEFEHGSHDPQTDVTGDDPILTGKIALAHMEGVPDYYERLERMEEDAARDWAVPRFRAVVSRTPGTAAAGAGSESSLVRLQRLDVRDKRVQLIVRENAAPVGHAHDRGAAEDAAGADDLLDLRVGVELAEEIRA